MLMKVHLSYYDQFKALRDESGELEKQIDDVGLRRRRRGPRPEGSEDRPKTPKEATSNSLPRKLAPNAAAQLVGACPHRVCV